MTDGICVSRRLRRLERPSDERALRRQRRARRLPLAARAALDRRNCLRLRAVPRRVHRQHASRRRAGLQVRRQGRIQFARGLGSKSAVGVGGRSARGAGTDGEGEGRALEVERSSSRNRAVTRCVVWRGPAYRRVGPLARLRVRMTP